MADKILFTRNLSNKLKAYALSLDLDIYSENFIKINLLKADVLLKNKILNPKFNIWIFTSANAVKFLRENTELVNLCSSRKIYALGQKTSDALKKIGLTASLPPKANSESLAQLLFNEKQKEDDILYFSGKMRLNTLVDFFADKNMCFAEVNVYETILISPKINVSSYKIICFCSPSAVKSFFYNYNVLSHVKIIAIGETTAKSIRENSNNNIIIANESNILSMIDKCKEYSK